MDSYGLLRSYRLRLHFIPLFFAKVENCDFISGVRKKRRCVGMYVEVGRIATIVLGILLWRSRVSVTGGMYIEIW